MKKILILLALLPTVGLCQFDNAKKLWARNVCSDAPSDTNVLAWSASRKCWAPAAGGGGSGTVTVVGAGTLTSTALVTGGGSQTIQTPSATATLDSSGNFSTPGSFTAGAGGTVAGFMQLGQGTAPSAGTNAITFYAPSSVTSYIVKWPATAATGYPLWTNTAGSVVVTIDSAVTRTIASGTVSLGTTTVNTGTCSSAIDGGTATGVLTTDVITATASADPTGVTGYTAATGGTLYVWAYPTADHVNFKLCNNSSSNITPGSSVTLNWKVIR